MRGYEYLPQNPNIGLLHVSVGECRKLLLTANQRFRVDVCRADLTPPFPKFIPESVQAVCQAQPRPDLAFLAMASAEDFLAFGLTAKTSPSLLQALTDYARLWPSAATWRIEF